MFLNTVVSIAASVVGVLMVAISLFGLPRIERRTAMRIFAPIDVWVTRHFAIPKLFYLGVGLLLGVVVVPNTLSAIIFFNEKKADFTISIQKLVGFEMPSTTKKPYNVEGVSILLYIGNSGDYPSTATDWELWLIEPSGKKYQGRIMQMVVAIDFPFKSGGCLEIPPENSLTERTAETPIQIGAKVNGVLQAELDGMPAATIPTDYTIEISALDIRGRKFSIKEKLKKIDDAPPQQYRGLKGVTFHSDKCPGRRQ